MPQTSSSDIRDYFAELYVSAQFADAGWSVYFPKRDVGFDLIATKLVNSEVLIRPVQVKGKFPEPNSGSATPYGYRGTLSAVHRDMVLAIPFFDSLPASNRAPAPTQIAYIPFDKISKYKNGEHASKPGTFASNKCGQHPNFVRYFNGPGLTLVEQPNWGSGA